MTKKTKKRINELEEAIEFLKFKIINPNADFVACLESASITRFSCGFKEYELIIKKVYMNKVITLTMPLGVSNTPLGCCINGAYVEIHREFEYGTTMYFSEPPKTLYQVIKVDGNTLKEIPTDLYSAAMKNKK